MHLYVIQTEAFTGYGITDNLNRRLRDHRCLLGKHNLNILKTKTFEMTREIAIEIEHQIKTTFKTKRQEIKGFKTEACAKTHYSTVIGYIKEKQNEIF
jgi:predicted GIY-YIG superfamily endonuclease